MISIVIPTYNRKSMLLEAIDSVRRQTYTNWEIILVDDHSTDGTQKAVQRLKEPRIRYFHNDTNKGPAYNRNFGFKKAKGDYIIFLDDDDYYIDPSFFHNAITAFSFNQDKDLVFVSANANSYHVLQDKLYPHSISFTDYKDGLEYLLHMDAPYKKPLSTFTTLFVADKLKQADLEHMEMVNDYAIYLRALLFGNVYILDELVGNYRVHSDNISNHIEKDFLIQNLEERVWVKEHLMDKADPALIQSWWKRQMLILVHYYFGQSNPSRQDKKEVLHWILEHSKDVPDMKSSLDKQRIKTWLKAKKKKIAP